MKILKFGGVSVGSAANIKRIIDIVRPHKSEIQAVVVSAFNGVTDALLNAASVAGDGGDDHSGVVRDLEERHLKVVEELISPARRARVIAQVKSTIHELEDVLKGASLLRECTNRTRDYVASFGERLSAYIISEAFSAQSVDAEYLDARDVIKTDRNFGAAQVNQTVSTVLLSEYFSRHPSLQIVTGFIASTERGETTTLGRGGSDYTASILGAALNASEIEIWTDVSGVMTADPRHVPRALSIKALTYSEAAELSHFGAKVIYPPTIQPALARKIPIRIRNTFEPEFPGTFISSEEVRHSYIVTGISSIDSISLMRVQGTGMIGVAGIARRVFAVLALRSINVILITQASSEQTICFAVLPERADEARDALENEFSAEIERGDIDGVIVEGELSIISAVGENMRKTPGISGRLFRSLGRNGVNVVAIAQGSSELSISVVVSRRDQRKALQSIHDEFFLSDVKAVHLFMVGKGRVGRTLLEQLRAHHDYLIEHEALDLRLTALADRSRMHFNERGIPLDQAIEALEMSEDASDLGQFVTRLLDSNLPHTIFVDCTANGGIPDFYPRLLTGSVSIVTPNKHSVGDTFDRYSQIKDLVRRRNSFFLFETCVGAGLPVISTLNDLLKSGDRITSIDAVLSGTLSFLFNTFKPGQKFSELLLEAHALGYTEPDPREDLCGMDVARKLLILGRECGLQMELDDIAVENLVPESLRGISDVESFLKKLPEADSLFGAKAQKAQEEGKRLCYVASLRDGKGMTALEAIGPDHPFFSLSGSDNMIAFTSNRYSSRPLVVKGPGAGPEVTAAGVFADIIRIAHQL